MSSHKSIKVITNMDDKKRKKKDIIIKTIVDDKEVVSSNSNNTNKECQQEPDLLLDFSDLKNTLDNLINNIYKENDIKIEKSQIKRQEKKNRIEEYNTELIQIRKDKIKKKIKEHKAQINNNRVTFEESKSYSKLVKSLAGYIIENKRKEIGMSQKNVTDIGWVGRQHLCEIEKGKVLINIPMFFKICYSMNVDPIPMLQELYDKSLLHITDKLNEPTIIERKNLIVFDRNIYIGIDCLDQSIKMSIYKVADFTHQVIVTDNDLKNLRDKYGSDVIVLLSKKHSHIDIVSDSTGDLVIRLKIMKVDFDITDALQYHVSE